MSASAYTCRFCRLPSDSSGTSCPNCGAAVDVTSSVSSSGWVKQPPVKDMAKIQFGQSHLQIEGTQVPVADFTLRGPEWIYFSHHVLLWTDPSAQLTNMKMKGGWNRVLAGMPLIMMQAGGPGHVALSDNHAGDLVALPLMPGQQMWVREHRFLAATGNVGYHFEQTGIWYVTGSGDDRETHYPMGQFGDRFVAQGSPGLLLLHSPGNTFVRDLAPGQTILIQPTALLYRDLSVRMHLHLEYPQARSFSFRRNYDHRNLWVRLVGPGRVAVQSVFERPEASEPMTSHSHATFQRW